MAEKNYNELLEAVRTINDIDAIGDGCYRVRDRELKGWDGPLVVKHAEATAVINRHLRGEG